MMNKYSGYQWIISDPGLLGGKPTVAGTRISVAQVLACLAEGMTPAEISQDYEGFPAQSVPEVLKFASERLDQVDKGAAA